MSFCTELDEGDYPENLQIVFLSYKIIAFFCTLYVFGSSGKVLVWKADVQVGVPASAFVCLQQLWLIMDTVL